MAVNNLQSNISTENWQATNQPQVNEPAQHQTTPVPDETFTANNETTSGANLFELNFVGGYQRSLLAKNYNTAPTTAAPQTQASTNNTDIEARAERIYKRFQDNGTLGLNSQTPLNDIWNDIGGLSPSEAKQLRDVYQNKYGRDLLADVARELPTIGERRTAFGKLAPEKVHEQITPLSPSQNGVGIVANPPLSEVVEGTNVDYSLRLPPAIRAANSRPDFVRFAYNDAPDGIGNSATTFSASYDEAGNRRVTFEVYQAGNPVPQYYTMQQLVRNPADKANEALLGLEQLPTDPELFMQGVDLQIELLENKLAELKNKLATEYRPDSFFEAEPPQKKQLKQQIAQIETALNELRQVKETLPGKLFDGAAGKTVAFKAVLVPTERPQPIPLQLYAKPLGNDTWAIVDATNPSDPQIYKGAEGGGLKGAWETFRNNNNLPAGSVAGTLPNGEGITANGQGGSGLKTWANRTGLLALGLAAAGVGALFVFPPAAPFLFGASAASGAVSGGLNIADRTTYGNFRWQSTETALDVLSIVGGIAGIGGAAKLGTAARTITTAEGATAQVSRVGNFIKVAQGVERGAAAGGFMLISTEYAQAFEKLNNLPPAEREQQAASLYKSALAAGAIIFVGGVVISRIPRLAPNDLNALLQKSNLSPELEALVRQEPGLQKALQTEGAEKYKQLYDDFLKNGKTGRATSQTFLDYLPKRGVSVSTARQDGALTDALGISASKLNSLPKRPLNEQLLGAINPQLLAKYKAGELPRGVETAIDNVLNRDFALTAQTTLSKARGTINKELNSAIGQNIGSIDELKQILSLYPGAGNSANRGSIGNAFYQSKLAQGERVREFNFSSELWTGGASINRRADELLIRGRRTLDIKTGYGDGAIEVEQLLDYNGLVKESRNPLNKNLRAYLEASGVKGGVMQSHDYLFLPNATIKAEDAARNAFKRIEKTLTDANLQSDIRNIRVFYLGDDGKIYQLVRTSQTQPVTAKLVGDKLPN